MNSTQPYRLTVVMTLTVVVGVAGILDAALKADGEDADVELIQRIAAQTTRGGVALRATRELRAGTRSGKHIGWMQVDTVTTPSGGFSWTVLEEGGSERTRNKVLRELLVAEQQASRTGRDEAALTRANYEFGPAVGVQSGQLEVKLIPRREDPRLIDGTLTVSADGSPVRLQGRLAKSPSFWVKSITVVKHFAKFDGVTLPTTVESLAELKMFGQASLTMRYRYSEVNGHGVTDAVAVLSRFGPSAEILALHAAVAQ